MPVHPTICAVQRHLGWKRVTVPSDASQRVLRPQRTRREFSQQAQSIEKGAADVFLLFPRTDSISHFGRDNLFLCLCSRTRARPGRR